MTTNAVRINPKDNNDPCYPSLTAMVVDIPHVCAAVREIAVENGLAERIVYHSVVHSSAQMIARMDQREERVEGIKRLDAARRMRQSFEK